MASQGQSSRRSLLDRVTASQKHNHTSWTPSTFFSRVLQLVDDLGGSRLDAQREAVAMVDFPYISLGTQSRLRKSLPPGFRPTKPEHGSKINTLLKAATAYALRIGPSHLIPKNLPPLETARAPELCLLLSCLIPENYFEITQLSAAEDIFNGASNFFKEYGSYRRPILVDRVTPLTDPPQVSLTANTTATPNPSMRALSHSLEDVSIHRDAQHARNATEPANHQSTTRTAKNAKSGATLLAKKKPSPGISRVRNSTAGQKTSAKNLKRMLAPRMLAAQKTKSKKRKRANDAGEAGDNGHQLETPSAARTKKIKLARQPNPKSDTSATKSSPAVVAQRKGTLPCHKNGPLTVGSTQSSPEDSSDSDTDSDSDSDSVSLSMSMSKARQGPKPKSKSDSSDSSSDDDSSSDESSSSSSSKEDSSEEETTPSLSERRSKQPVRTVQPVRPIIDRADPHSPQRLTARVEDPVPNGPAPREAEKTGRIQMIEVQKDMLRDKNGEIRLLKDILAERGIDENQIDVIKARLQTGRESLSNATRYVMGEKRNNRD